MLRSNAQNRAFHSIMSDFARQFSHEGIHLTAAEFKIIICSYFEAALAEADGREVKPIPLPESTSKMDVERMSNLIEYVLYLSAQMGIEISEITCA